jgi:hypothetical protein
MKTTVSFYDFKRAFVDCGRENQFSHEGLKVLFDYHEDYEEQTGEELELDVIAMCCGYSEDHPDDIISIYSIDVDGMDEDEKLDAVRSYLDHHTTVVGETSSGIVYACL